MFDLTLAKIIRSYNTIKRLAIKSYENKDLDSFIDNADLAANVANQFNWIYKDGDFENIFRLVGIGIVHPDLAEYTPKKNRIIFYDEIGSIACLSIQYLRALIHFKYDILYIFESGSRKLATSIESELNEYNKCTIIKIDSSCTNKIQEIKSLYEIIIAFQPELALLETPAEGAFGAILWNALPQIRRFRIVPGDHHFYFGTSCSDFYLEFRNFGYTIALEKRDIKENQILIQPYYPLVDNTNFEGFPKEVVKDNSVIIFSASSPYKVYGENDVYFNVLLQILNSYPQIIILFAGGGHLEPFKKFINKNNFQSRIFLLGYRKDLNMCIANSDIYLCTFPMTGGLTTQLAAYYAKPILSYTTDKLPGNKIEDIIEGIKEDQKKMTYSKLEEFYDYAKRLIEDREYREIEGKQIKVRAVTENQFGDILNQNLSLYPILKLQKIYIDYEKIINVNLEVENFYLPSFKLLILKILLCKFSWRFYYLIPNLVFSRILSNRVLSILLKRILILIPSSKKDKYSE